jgi:hypothetical protein
MFSCVSGERLTGVMKACPLCFWRTERDHRSPSKYHLYGVRGKHLSVLPAYSQSQITSGVGIFNLTTAQNRRFPLQTHRKLE